jgi:hypothetical protein
VANGLTPRIFRLGRNITHIGVMQRLSTRLRWKIHLWDCLIWRIEYEVLLFAVVAVNEPRMVDRTSSELEEMALRMADSD